MPKPKNRCKALNKGYYEDILALFWEDSQLPKTSIKTVK
jgi:hypothetical protein